jgi:Questin oxidase-like
VTDQSDPRPPETTAPETTAPETTAPETTAPETTAPEAAAHEEVLDESLHRLAATGPEFRGGLSNHGPMAAEAMVRLGRADDVESWLDGYLRRLEETPGATGRITDQTWRDALGQVARVTDWEHYLNDQLADEPWRQVLARWWPRLLPGVAAAATHGIIRTSHAARSLDQAPSPERLAEFARGLAYWAASYLELPGTPRTSGHLGLDEAVEALPVAPGPVPPGLITARLRTALSAESGFPAAVSALRPPADVPADLLELGRTFARVFLAYGRTQPIDFLHAVTAPVAARSVLGLLPAALARPSYDALWQIAAGLFSGFAIDAVREPLPTTAPPAPDTLTERAVATGDEHAIKMTEACLRLYAESPDPLLLHAAARASELLA